MIERATLLRSGLAAVGLIAAAASLSGCSDFRQAFGFDRSVPDEFAVVSRAPLEMPPDFSLPPPQPGAPRPQEGTARERAQAAIAGERPTGAGFTSAGEMALLRQAGAGSAPSDIRIVVDREAAAELESSGSFVDRLLFWQPEAQPSPVVDAAAEARRLAANQAAGQPLNQGEVPVIQRRRRAPLEGVFDSWFD